MNAIFSNRISAGQQLADSLQDYQLMPDTIVVGVARHGIPVAVGLAEALGLDMDVLGTQAIILPRRNTVRLGIMAGQGSFALDPSALDKVNLRQGEFTSLLNNTRFALNQHNQEYRTLLAALPLHNKNVILVDDGVCSGLTIKAAIKAVLQQQPNNILVAVPAGSIAVIDALRSQVEGVVCLSLHSKLTTIYDLYEETADTATTMLDHWLSNTTRQTYPDAVAQPSIPQTRQIHRSLTNTIPYSLGIRAQWNSYFQEFSRLHQGWSMSVKVYNLPVAREYRVAQLPVKASRLIRKPIDQAPLVYLRYEAANNVLVLEYQDNHQLRQWQIEQPLRISCREQLGQRKELRIENQQGTLFSVQLQAARHTQIPFSAAVPRKDTSQP